jgi:protein gp37
MILTKRTDQLELWHHVCGWHPYPNLWLGVTVENQKRADERIPILFQIPAAVRFVSVEPMLSEMDISGQVAQRWTMGYSTPMSRRMGLQTIGVEKPRIDWVICGAETGPGARPMDPDWARSLRDQCQEAGVPFFFKRDSDGNRTLDGEMWEQYPEMGGQLVLP